MTFVQSKQEQIEVCFSPDVILCGWLGSKYQVTNSLTLVSSFFSLLCFVSLVSCLKHPSLPYSLSQSLVNKISEAESVSVSLSLSLSLSLCLSLSTHSCLMISIHPKSTLFQTIPSVCNSFFPIHISQFKWNLELRSRQWCVCVCVCVCVRARACVCVRTFLFNHSTPCFLSLLKLLSPLAKGVSTFPLIPTQPLQTGIGRH